MSADVLKSIMNEDAQKSFQQKVSFFKALFQISLTKEEMNKITAFFYEQSVSQGKIICRQQQELTSIIIIKEGVAMLKHTFIIPGENQGNNLMVDRKY